MYHDTSRYFYNPSYGEELKSLGVVGFKGLKKIKISN